MSGEAIVAGIFVGGASSRMGTPKGLLPLDDGRSLVERWRDVVRAIGVRDVVLVGRRPEYAAIELAALADEPPGIGPIGGLAALLRYAGDRGALALACDMPFVEAADLARLRDHPRRAALAPRREGRWEPLCALYDAPAVRPAVLDRIARGERSLQGLLDAIGATAIEIDPAHLDDWDRPEDRAPR